MNRSKSYVRLVLMPSLVLVMLLIPFSARVQTLSDMVSDGKPLALRVGVSGEVGQVLVKQGEQVSKGQLLLKLDDTVFKAQLEAAAAYLEQSEAKSKLHKGDYEREQELYAEGSSSTVRLQQQENQWLASKAEYAQAKAQHLQAQQSLRLSTIRDRKSVV